MGSVCESLGSGAEIWGQVLRCGVNSVGFGSFPEVLGSGAEIWGQVLRFGVVLWEFGVDSLGFGVRSCDFGVDPGDFGVTSVQFGVDSVPIPPSWVPNPKHLGSFPGNWGPLCQIPLNPPQLLPLLVPPLQVPSPTPKWGGSPRPHNVPPDPTIHP